MLNWIKSTRAHSGSVESEKEIMWHAQLDQKERELQEANGQLAAAEARIAELQRQMVEQFTHTRLSLGVAGPLSEIREKTASASRLLLEEQSKLGETTTLFEQSSELLAKINQDIGELGQATDISHESLQQLDNATQGITQFTEVISGISAQTNLLALNAAIEAARAGEQGRGFAVVADEVRTLAGKTAEATEQINDFVRGMMEHSDTTKSAFQRMVEGTRSMESSVSLVSKVVDEVLSMANRMSDIIGQSTADSFIGTVKMDHIIYKLEIYKRILGLSDSDSASPTDHHQCRLGHWYYQGDGYKHFRGSNAYRDMEQPHQRLHQQGAAAVECEVV